MIKVVFFSSSDIAIPLLSALTKDSRYKISMVVTQPDKPAGRSLILKKNPVKLLSEKFGIEVYQPEKLNDDGLKKLELLNSDIFLTFAYGKILPVEFLKLPILYPINVHASLLPKYRGASPIQAAILNSEKKTGITIMKMVQEMDAGPIFEVKEIPIESDMNANTLFENIAKTAADFVPDALSTLKKDSQFYGQDHNLATFSKKINKDDGYLDFNRKKSEILSIFKAYSPWPGVWTTYNKMRLKLIDITISNEKIEPGLVTFNNSVLKIGTSDGSIEVHTLQLESKNVLSAKDFVSGQNKFIGITLPS